MKLKLKTTMAGPKGTSQPGDIIDLEPEAAEQLIDGGFAESLESSVPAAAPSTPNPDGLDALKMQELREKAKELGIPAPGGVTKEALIAAIRQAVATGQ